MRKIVHIDMDAFYASVEQRDNPSLRGRPVVVAWRGARSVVCAASYEARRYGIRSAMPALRAEALCPQAVFVPPDFARYKAVSRQVRGIFARHTDLIEPLSLDEAYLDVTDPLSGLPSATAVARAIRASIREETGLTASAGVAPNKFLAKIASDWRKPDGLFVIRPEQALDFLGPLPVGIVPGVGKVTAARLEGMGLATVGDLRRAGAATLEQAFGSWGQRLAELALGIDERSVQTDRPTRSVSSEDTFPDDRTLDALEPAIRALAARTWTAAAREQGRHPRTVVLKLKTARFQTLTRSLTPPAMPESAEALARMALDLRQRVDLPAGTTYRLVGVGLSNFIGDDEAPPQRSLFPLLPAEPD